MTLAVHAGIKHKNNQPAHVSLRILAHAINRDFLSFKKIESFQLKNFDIFLIFAQNIDCGYMSTHNLCFGAKLRKIGIPLQTPVLLYKSGVYGGIHCTDM